MSAIDTHCLLGPGVHVRQTADELLRRMDRCEVSRAIVSPVDQYAAVRNIEGNDQMIDAMRAHPDRLIGFASINPWYGPDALAELERCMDRGLRGLALDTSLHGCFFTDGILVDLVGRAASFGVPIYCHTGTPIYSLPLGLMELALQFPGTQFILGSVAYADGWYDVLPAARAVANISVETSHGSMQILETVIRELGASRVLFGSNTPISSMESELLKIQRLPIGETDRQKIMGGNATKLLGISL